jgi:hypothetical protein
LFVGLRGEEESKKTNQRKRENEQKKTQQNSD